VSALRTKLEAVKESREREGDDLMSTLSACRIEGATSRSAIPRIRRRCRPEHVLVACGLALLPWLVVLANGLPATTTASHWCTAWIGLDTMEAVGLLTTGLLAVRGKPLHVLTAIATAMLLSVDAWFDTMTAAPGADQISAVAMAFCAELPLAVVCVVMAARGFARLTA